MFGFGGTELMVVLVIVLLLFGPSQLPKMAKGFGQAIREFKRAQHEVMDELQREEPKPPAPQPPPSDNKPIQ